jgi:2-oxoglutarate/2-oxoacid ferredoxin oxidoreductase subunit beta
METTAIDTAACPQALTPANFVSSQEVRWCLGCGDYSILKVVRQALAEIGTKPENTAFISGIGCSAAFPTMSKPTDITPSTAARRRLPRA